MKKIYLFKTLLLLCALVAGSGSVWAEDELYYTLDGTITTGGNSNYAQDGGGLTQNDIEWSVTGNTTINPWRIGGKNLTKEDREAYTKTAMGEAISKIELELGSITLTSVNSIKLIVASDSEFSSVLQTIEETSITANSTLTLTPSASEWATGSYYKFVFNVTAGSSNSYIQLQSVKFYHNISDNLSDPELAFSLETVSCDLLSTFVAPTLTFAESFDGTINYVSSNEDVATVNATTGEVTLVAVGTTTITASSVATLNFKAGSASYTLTVTKNEGVDPVRPVDNGYYELVTDATTLVAGDKIIIVDAESEYALSTTQNSNNRAAVAITPNSDGTINADASIQAITLEASDGNWYFNVGDDAYLYAASGSSNHLKTSSKNTAGDNGIAKITISEGIANITFQGSNSRNVLRFNPNNGSPLFACYASTSTTGSEPKIYRYVPVESNETTVTLSDYGYKTLVVTNNYTVTGATAYIVTAATTSSVTTQAIDVVPANAPVFLKGDANAEVTLNFTEDEADDVTANKLAVSTADQGDGCYVLAVLEGEVGFYKWAGGSLGAGRVILPASEVPAQARQFLTFNETTGIDEIANVNKADGEWFDLQGRRVVKAQKGLYIMNGKKVMVK